VDDRLDLPFERLGEFLSLAREDLDPVVLERIVRRGDDQAGIEPHGSRDIGDRRRRNDAGRRDLRPGGVDAARQLALDPLARLPRVASDENPQRPTGMTHRAHERAAEASDRLMVERIFAGLAANAIGAEEPLGHGVGHRVHGLAEKLWTESVVAGRRRMGVDWRGPTARRRRRLHVTEQFAQSHGCNCSSRPSRRFGVLPLIDQSTSAQRTLSRFPCVALT
jgi:hypothetical protein